MDHAYKPCNHVIVNKKDLLLSYEILHAYFVACIAKNSFSRKKELAKCYEGDCHLKNISINNRIHACLSCQHFGCFKRKHIHLHSRAKNHVLAMDTNYGYVFCFACNDYQYDADFEKIARQQNSNPVCQRGLSINFKLKPSIEQINATRGHKVTNLCDTDLRPMVNMGNTCYINAILQSLVHAPAFRNFFFSLKHKCNRTVEPFESKGVYIANPPYCFACETSNFVEEYFSGKKEPCAPHRLLLLLWIKYEDFRGYSKQDANEFFLHLLDNLHLNCQGMNENSTSDQPCQCFIDHIFTGSSMSIKTCTKCKNTFAKHDTFKCLYFNSCPESKEMDEDGRSIVSFMDCLEKSLQDVILGFPCQTCCAHITTNGEYPCERCLKQATHNEEIIIERLPLIINFQFNFTKGSFKSKKKKNAEDVILHFPEFFDMTPYILPFKDRNNAAKLHRNPSNFFYLFAVVEFSGRIEDGHYTTYVRKNKNNWFKCNDECIEKSSLQKVLQIDPYLLFYHRPIDGGK